MLFIVVVKFHLCCVLFVDRVVWVCRNSDFCALDLLLVRLIVVVARSRCCVDSLLFVSCLFVGVVDWRLVVGCRLTVGGCG